MIKRKICIFSGSRAEYGLLKPLIHELKAKSSFELQLIVSGMHLSPEFGYTCNDISLEEFSKVEKVEILLSSDTRIGISKAMGLGMISYSEALSRLKPDLLIGLGDRFELFSVVSSALINKIPVAHIHGGELTFGAFDECLRHSITKMSLLHFTSTEVYRKRVIQLGEHPDRVYNVGALGLDNIKKLELFSKSNLSQSINFELDKPYFVITFHPATYENQSSAKHFSALLQALSSYQDYKLIFTKSNADNEGRAINKLIDNFVEMNKQRAIAYTSLGQLRYLSALKHSTMVIGNSSSGIIEMPFFKKPTINIGDRQKGRLFCDSIIQCSYEKDNIMDAIKIGLSTVFQRKIKDQRNIYGDGRSAEKICEVLNNSDFRVSKEFYDIKQKIQYA